MTRLPHSPYYNPYNKYMLEVFPDTLIPFLFAFAKMISISIPHFHSRHDFCSYLSNNRVRHMPLWFPYYLKLHIHPNLGRRSKIYKVSLSIDGFLAPSSNGVCDQHNAPRHNNSINLLKSLVQYMQLGRHYISKNNYIYVLNHIKYLLSI